VDLGLIYSVECTDGDVHVMPHDPDMPVRSWIMAPRSRPAHASVRRASRSVFDPPWNAEMLSASGRRHLGWAGKIEA
jgi:metal-sulfur cluster biosynthetic enzyme